jgi:hypothetical protein
MKNQLNSYGRMVFSDLGAQRPEDLADKWQKHLNAALAEAENQVPSEKNRR